MIIFFVIGITLFLLSQREMLGVMDLAEESYLQSSSVVLKNKINEEYYSVGYEIITQKISLDTVPIVVEGVTIEKIDDLLTIKIEEEYLKKVVLDENGQLKYIEYKEK